MAVYPTGIVGTGTLITIVATEPTNNPSHTGQHNNINGEVIAIETALGTSPQGVYSTVSAALSTYGTLITAAQTTATTGVTNALAAQTTANTAVAAASAAQTTASGARLLASGLTWIAGNVSAGQAYVVAPFGGTVTGWFCQGSTAPAVPGLVTVLVGSAGAVLLTCSVASAGSNGLVTTFTNTSGTTTITAGASMLINLAGSGTAFQQSVTLAIARTAQELL